MGGDWQAWHREGSGLYYARRVKSSPPVVLRAPNRLELAAQMDLADVLCPRGDYWRQVLAERSTQDDLPQGG